MFERSLSQEFPLPMLFPEERGVALIVYRMFIAGEVSEIEYSTNDGKQNPCSLI